MQSRNLHISGVYAFIHRDSLRCYVGSSVDIAKRLSEHYSAARRGVRNRLYDTMREKGAGAFDAEVLEQCNRDQLLARERFYMALLGAAQSDGLNTRENPEAHYGLLHSKATRARISLSLTGRKLSDSHRTTLIGRRQTSVSCELRSLKLKGRVFTEAHRAKLSASATGRVMSAEAVAKLRLRKASIETRARISIAKRLCSDETRERMRIAARLRMTPEVREKLRCSSSGKKHTAETRAKMSATHKARFTK